MYQKELNHFAHYYWSLLGILLTIVTFVGCTVSQPNISENESLIVSTDMILAITTNAVSPSATSVPLETLKHTVTTTPTPSVVPTQAITETLLPTMTAASILTPIPILTPLPTIPPQQRGEVYTDFMRNNGGCALPCWWGFKLVESTLDEVRQYYETFDVHITEQVGHGGISVLYAQFVDPKIENGEQVRHTFVAQNGAIIDIEIQLKVHPNYQIELILEQLGQPSEVWMWTIPEPYEDILPADFLLYFPEQSALVGYRTKAVRVEDTVNVCFDGQGGGTILLWNPAVWNPNGDKGFVERTNESSELTLEGHRPLDKVSNWDVEQFYTILSDPTRSECLETPSDLWSSP